MSALLEVTGLSRSFGAVLAVSAVDLAIWPGEIVGIIGPNGCGKTTLFNCISGFIRPSAGSVRWREQDVTRWPMRRIARDGMVRTFQQAMSFPSAGSRANVEMALAIQAGGHGRERRESAVPCDSDGLLEFCGLRNPPDTPAGQLPFGDLRRLGIALALTTRPLLLLLDEPAAGLNPAEIGQLSTLLRTLRDAGVTLAVVDHDMDFLLPLVDRLVVLANGSKLTEGSPNEVRTNPAVIDVYLGASRDSAQRPGRANA